MRQKSVPEKASAEQVVKDIRRATRRQFSAEEKIRIVLEGVRGEESIAKNAVILVGQIEDERAAGKSVVEAAIDAAGTRFRPIMLTAISTVLGMIPIAPTVFWGPMAFAILGGLLVATVLTLVLLPVLYVTVFGASASRSKKTPVAGAGASLS